MRAGGFTLTLLGSPRIYRILCSLAGGTKAQLEIRRAAGYPAESTLRGHLRTLEGIGAMTRERLEVFPGSIECRLTEVGEELIIVAESIGRWLDRAPGGPLELGTDAAKAAIKGLVDGWSATVIGVLADEPLPLTELDKRISSVSYPTLERCLQTMRLAEQLEVGKRTGKGTPYALTEWLRHSLTPLALAARWEHRHQPEGAEPVAYADVDDAVMLGRPLLRLSDEAEGVCQVALSLPEGKVKDDSLAYLRICDGELRLDEEPYEMGPDASASGTAEAWFATVIDADTARLRLQGDHELADALIGSVHDALFSDAIRR